MSRLRWSSWRVPVAALAVLFAVVSCGGGDTEAPQERISAGAEGEIVVFAAASLTEAFTELGTKFEAENPEADVEFNFAGSNTLATQLIHGAPADVYASANTEQMQRVQDAGLVHGQPIVFVSNRLRIAVPEGNPANVHGLTAFGKEKLDIVICAPKVPCGDLARQLFEIAGIEPQPDSLAQDVKQVLTKVALGEADAGLVYRTDVASATRPVDGIDIPASGKAANDYEIAMLKRAPNKGGAQAFVDFVLSPTGQRVMKSYGFTPQAA